MVTLDQYAMPCRLIREGEYAQSIARFNHILSLNPTDALCWYKRSVALFELNRFEEAIISINKAIKFVSPNKPLEHISRFATSYFVLKRNCYLEHWIGKQGYEELMALEDDSELIAWLQAAIYGDFKAFGSGSKLMSFLAKKDGFTLRVIFSVLNHEIKGSK